MPALPWPALARTIASSDTHFHYMRRRRCQSAAVPRALAGIPPAVAGISPAAVAGISPATRGLARIVTRTRGVARIPIRTRGVARIVIRTCQIAGVAWLTVTTVGAELLTVQVNRHATPHVRAVVAVAISCPGLRAAVAVAVGHVAIAARIGIWEIIYPPIAGAVVVVRTVGVAGIVVVAIWIAGIITITRAKICNHDENIIDVRGPITVDITAGRAVVTQNKEQVVNVDRIVPSTWRIGKVARAVLITILIAFT